MKTFSKLLVLMTAVIVLVASCTKNENPSEEISQHYYVKYVVTESSGNSFMYNYQLNGWFINEKKEKVSFSTPGEYVIGPVSKGFTAKVNTNWPHHAYSQQILVSIENEPFTIKASKTITSFSGELNYTVL